MALIVQEAGAGAFIPPRPTLRKLRKAAAGCRGCPLWQKATQTVFGVGSATALLMLVGEVPGNDEDLAGKPFVGPAGKLLDRALAESGIDRRRIYVTNAVKHFKWEPRGKRRLHKKPSAREIAACRPWLDAEIALIQPRVIVALGATAAQSLLGRTFRLTQHRDEFFDTIPGSLTIATIHPSAILRAPDEAAREEAMRGLIADLKLVARRL